MSQNIHQKMTRVMADVRFATKSGQMMDRYQYHDREDALCVRPALIRHGISFACRAIDSTLHIDVSPKGEHMLVITVECVFTSDDDGSTITASAVGAGMGKRDQIASKAQTNAIKNLLLNEFLLGDHDYGDGGAGSGDSSQPQRAPSPEPKKMDSGSRDQRAERVLNTIEDALVSSIGLSEEHADVYITRHIPSIYNVSEIGEVTPTQLEAFGETLQNNLTTDAGAVTEKINNTVQSYL